MSDYEQTVEEMAEWEDFFINFVGPPTREEVEEAVASEIEHIDQVMMLNAV